MSEPKLKKAYWGGDPRRGAALGRSDHGEPTGKVRLYRVHLDSGGYDNGGAYWGISSAHLYRAFGEGFEWFARAHSRKEAVQYLKSFHPNIKLARSG